MSKQIYIDSNGNEIQVSGTVNTADMMPMSGNDSTKVSEAIGVLSNLDTSTQTSLVAAINELVATSKLNPVYGNTASGAIATFDTSLALPLQDCTIAINAVQESGTPTPSSPKAISGFTGADIAVYNENLITSMATSSTDGITTSYDNTTGLISIENNSRTTNYTSGSTRAHVATGLNSSHTYKYEIIPNVVGVTLIGDGSTALSKDGFTGYTVADLRITTYYDFVNDHPIGSVTKVRLVLYDVTTGVLNTYPITWQSEAGTVYGGSLDVTNGKLTITHKLLEFDYQSNWKYEYAEGGNFYVSCGSDVKANQYGNDVWCNCSNASEILYTLPNTCLISVAKNFNFTWGATLGIASADDFKTYLQTNNLVIQVKCLLETPVTYQLTPTQINTIVGTNNVFTDTNGDTSLEYYTKRGEQTVRIAEGVAVDVINNKNIDNLTTTNKTLVGAVNEVNANKANKTLVNDLIKVKYFTLLAANVTQNMDLSSNVSLDSGYKFLCYMPAILPDGFTTDQYLWISAPTNIQGNPWWKTNPISGAGAGSKLRFFYLEIKDIN